MKPFFYILFCLAGQVVYAQKSKVLNNETPEYFRNEEIIHANKRYRIHNNYLTFGPGFLSSNIRNVSQKSISVDYQFHIKREHFQAGVMMSGQSLGSNNNSQIHFGYGYRKESIYTNYGFFAGPSYFTGVTTSSDSTGTIIPLIYTKFGFYLSAHAIYKITYDIGLGVETFAEFSQVQRMFGIKLIAYFSGAYVGPKRNYNPNVRSEKPR